MLVSISADTRHVVRYAIDLTINTLLIPGWVVVLPVAGCWWMFNVNRLGNDGWWPVLVDADAESDLI